MNFNIRNETARGLMLIGVFFSHGLYAYQYNWGWNDWHQAPITFAFIKVMTPQISIYFFLNGMSMRGIGKKSLRAALPQSFMLIFLAWVSEGLGILFLDMTYGGYGHGLYLLREAVKPMLYGTGGCTFVTWFFTVLAVCRPLVWLYERNKIHFACAWLAVAALILLARSLHLPDNLWEWRNWPAATLFMIIGMKIRPDWRVPHWLGLAAFLAMILLSWFDAPGMWRTLPCLTCHMNFDAEPELGSYGFLPVLILDQVAAYLFWLWASQDPPRLLGRFCRYLGRASLQLLLLHGWLLITLIPFLTHFLPPRENVAVLLAILVVTPPVHAVVFKFTETPLNRILAMCFSLGRKLTDFCYRAAEAAGGSARRPAPR